MIITLLKTFLLPPALQICLLTVGVIFWRKSKKIAFLLILFSWLSLLLLSLPIVGASLFKYLESPYLLQQDITLSGTDGEADVTAIVILGGGRQRHLPEYGRDQVSYHSLWRLRYGARLANSFGLPVIVSGGTVYPYETVSEAAIATQVLKNEFSVDEVWQEGNSRDTWENAFNTAELARQKGIKKVILVTHAYHMRRAELAFAKAGLDVVPMATGFFSVSVNGWLTDWLPQASGLNMSRIALHEYLGLVFYHLRQ